GGRREGCGGRARSGRGGPVPGARRVRDRGRDVGAELRLARGQGREGGRGDLPRERGADDRGGLDGGEARAVDGEGGIGRAAARAWTSSRRVRSSRSSSASTSG